MSLSHVITHFSTYEKEKPDKTKNKKKTKASNNLLDIKIDLT